MLSIRPATMADAKNLFDWRNDPVTRVMCRNTDTVEWADHLAWLRRMLFATDHLLFVIEINGTPAATMRFDIGRQTEANFTIAPRWRCRGMSLSLMKLGLDAGPPCEFWIKQENSACQRLAAACGAELIESGPLQHWRYDEGKVGLTSIPSLRRSTNRRPASPGGLHALHFGQTGLGIPPAMPG